MSSMILVEQLINHTNSLNPNISQVLISTLGTHQALERRRFLCEQPLSRGISCRPLLRTRVEENSSLQNDANIVTYVKGWALRCARVDQKPGSFRKANEVSKGFRIAE